MIYESREIADLLAAILMPATDKKEDAITKALVALLNPAEEQQEESPLWKGEGEEPQIIPDIRTLELGEEE